MSRRILPVVDEVEPRVGQLRLPLLATALDLHQSAARQCPRGQPLRVRRRPVRLTVRKPAEHRELSFVEPSLHGS